MDLLNSMTAMTAMLADSQTAFLLLVFGAVVLGVAGIGALVPSRADARRMRRTAAAGGAGGARNHAGVSLRPQSPFAKVERFLAPYGQALEPQNAAEHNRMRMRLMRAGFMQPNAVILYYGLRVGLGLLPPIAMLIALPLLVRVATLQTLFFTGAALLAIGFYLPALVVAARVQERTDAIRIAFPDALDLMLVCVEAGLGLDAAIKRVADELALSHPVLAEHLAMCSLEFRAGSAREDALRNLADRTGVQEINSFATLLIQSQELGTSVGDTLRVYSDDMRYRRMMAAEEKAQKLPAKMIIPMGLCLMPALMTVILSPAVLRIMKAFSGGAGN